MVDQVAVEVLERFVGSLEHELDRLDEDQMLHEDALVKIRAEKESIWSQREEIFKSIERLKRPPGILSGGVMDISGTGFIGKF